MIQSARVWKRQKVSGRRGFEAEGRGGVERQSTATESEKEGRRRREQ